MIEGRHDMRPLRLAAETSDAYSADAWGPVAWCEAATMLCGMGLSDAEVRGVLRSKMTRWARDAYDHPATRLGALFQLVTSARPNGLPVDDPAVDGLPL